MQCLANPPLITTVDPTTPGALWLHAMPMRHGGGSGGDVPLIVSELEPNLAEIMHLSVGQLLNGEDRRPVEQSQQAVPLAVELYEGLRQP